MLNKKEFITLIAERNNTTKVEATKIVEAFLDGLEAACEQGTGVNFVGLMKAEIVDIPERHGVTKLGGEEKEWNGIIENLAYHELPHTGGSGTGWYMVGGIFLMTGSGILLTYKYVKRRKWKIF